MILKDKMTSPGKTKEDVKEGDESGKVKQPAKKRRRKREGCSLYSCKEEEAEEAKKRATPAKKKKEKKKRCALDSCKTKLGLTAYQCRCGRFLFFFLTSM